jgi:KDO2-lipid IV(A) lauroyltransferase
MRGWLIRGFLRLMSWLPLPLNHAVGSIIGCVAYWFPTRVRRITEINIERCFTELDARQRRQLVRQSLREAGKTLSEMGILWYRQPRRVLKLIRQLSGIDYIEQAHQAGKGILFLTPHLGAWEITALFQASHSQLTCLYRPPRVKALEAMLMKVRSRTGAKLVPTTSSGVKALYQALEKGEDVGLLPDQDPGKGGAFVPFFGIPANTMVLVSRLVQKTGAVVLLGYAERLPYGRGYHLHIEPVSETIHDPDTNTATASMNRAIEDVVRRLPGQYQWSYRRFKKRPPGDNVKFYR